MQMDGDYRCRAVDAAEEREQKKAVGRNGFKPNANI